jgi:hypothetical protein
MSYLTVPYCTVVQFQDFKNIYYDLPILYLRGEPAENHVKWSRSTVDGIGITKFSAY